MVRNSRRLRAGFAALLVSFSFAAAATLVEPKARASVGIAIYFDDLLGASRAAVVATATEQHAVWENGRIYTYSRVRVERAVAGDFAVGEDVWVRTMGGVVGDVGQSVDGEAVLSLGSRSLFFLHPGPVGAQEVTARAQGQFPVVAEATKPLRLMQSSAAGVLLAPNTKRAPGLVPLRTALRGAPALARELLHGQSLDDAARQIAAAWRQTHAR